MPRRQTTALRRPRAGLGPAAPKPAPLAPAAAETLTEQAYRLIEEQIVTLRLKPGDVLSEQMLSATFRIGRTPVREALQRLAHEGLVILIRATSFWSSKCAVSWNGS
jgi:DNA-binding GntR family transcriptional regulator